MVLLADHYGRRPLPFANHPRTGTFTAANCFCATL